MVKFDHYSGPTLHDGMVPIAPVRRRWYTAGQQCTRTQLPLKLAWAVTIHKAQGLTLNKVVINIGKKEFSTGLTFIACSRVRRLNDIIFDPPFSFDRLTTLSTSSRLHERMQEDRRLKNLAPSSPIQESPAHSPWLISPQESPALSPFSISPHKSPTHYMFSPCWTSPHESHTHSLCSPSWTSPTSHPLTPYALHPGVPYKSHPLTPYALNPGVPHKRHPLAPYALHAGVPHKSHPLTLGLHLMSHPLTSFTLHAGVPHTNHPFALHVHNKGCPLTQFTLPDGIPLRSHMLQLF